ncbi:hypothetical protein Y032_0004g2098 [Ancylostoma ceylanicum]|uniref:Uncharacterized protein n=1 Tax=Ancylostoma ceylanicum TaxID=53326 RepID=A0A016VWB0_9BILA|nr:hypothetical protein Y032_0004g2098 [Ancylostoma ceylanicum]
MTNRASASPQPCEHSAVTVRALFNDCTTSSDGKRSDGHCGALGRSLQSARTFPCLRPYHPRWREALRRSLQSAPTVRVSELAHHRLVHEVEQVLIFL